MFQTATDVTPQLQSCPELLKTQPQFLQLFQKGKFPRDIQVHPTLVQNDLESRITVPSG